MTAPQEPQELQQYDAGSVQYAPATQVRLMPRAPLGSKPTLDVTQLVDVGALLGAHGLERGEVSALIDVLQTIMMDATLTSLPKVLERIKIANVARLRRLSASIKDLPKVRLATPQQGWRGAMGGTQVDPAEYVDLKSVQLLIAAAISENPAT